MKQWIVFCETLFEVNLTFLLVHDLLNNINSVYFIHSGVVSHVSRILQRIPHYEITEEAGMSVVLDYCL